MLRLPILRQWAKQPLDRTALTLMTVLAVLIGLLLWGGDHTVPKVREFSWQDQQIGQADIAFTLTFNRPMDWDSVAENLSIDPLLPGKVSWSGRRLAYTLTEPIPYGELFRVRLSNAQERVFGTTVDPKTVQPFEGTFRSRDRAFAYVGVSGAEAGRLVLNNLTQDTKVILTPENLSVLHFQPYPQGNRILFSATDRNGVDGVDPRLYIVTTGANLEADSENESLGRITQVLDNRDYQLLKFDLSADGERIVIQRADRQLQGQSSLWQLVREGRPRPIETESGGDFLIAPDSQTLVMAQGQGLAIIPLAAETDAQPLDFLPQFGTVLSFRADGAAAAMVKFNPDFTRSLFLVTTQGTQTELLRTEGSILQAAFGSQGKILYGVFTRLLPGEEYREQPYLGAVDLETQTLHALLDLPGQPDLTFSLAADGTALLFDLAIPLAGQQQAPETLTTERGSAIASSQLWWLPLDESGLTAAQPQRLAAGLNPVWLP
ncbi:hypothetical protein GS597_14575 [Synechococcales cyanobacterium C]|uniref:SbsA Ig-like domain-containing protein n=1 Tax=Petrachloros mirabilis ULC683 TaxID=2781853 RepID=A0A8K1ZZJ3_9CYAN|nr:hypothetical protein [Petrachloros mirabilis]NCJ07713.1 hypothetical protein [Petrachloros mirabilis ULC683]